MNASDPASPAPPPAIDIVVDGHRADLLEMSSSRALMYCTMTLRPEQKVRVVLRSNGSVVRAQARVTLAKYEMPKEGPRYRVELAFEGDTSAIEKLVTEQPR
jgi:hypothetical protein